MGHIFGNHMDDYRDQTEVVPGVFVDPGESVTIVDRDGEVVHWTADEWIEDPEAVTATVNLSILAAVKGPEAARESIEQKGKTLVDLIDETMYRVRPDGVEHVIVPLPGHAITITLSPPNEDGSRSGAIESTLDRLADDDETLAAITGIESFLLALAIEGVKVDSDNVLNALQVALDGIGNNL